MQSHSSILCKAVFVAQPALWPSSVSPARRFSEPHRDFPHHVILTTETGNTVLDCTWTVLGHLGCLILSCWGMSKCGCSIKRHAQSPIANLYRPPDNPAVHGMNVSRIRFPNKIIDLADLSDVTKTYSNHLIPRNAMPNAYSHSIHSNWLSGPLQSTVKSLIDFRMLGGKSSVAP